MSSARPLPTLGALGACAAALLLGSCGNEGPTAPERKATKLLITEQPSSAVAGSGGITLSVQIVDADDVPFTGYAPVITVTLGTNPGAATLTGTMSVLANLGAATFDGLSISKPGTGYTLSVSADGLVGATSSAFNVLPAATTLVWLTQPSTTVAGAVIGPSLQLQWQDGDGNIATSATDEVVVAVVSAPAGTSLGGTLIRAPVNGVATFDDLTLTTAGNYTLRAQRAGGSTFVNSAGFQVTPAAASRLEFVDGPSGRAIHAVLPDLTVRVVDAYGNDVTAATNTVDLLASPNPQGATVNGGSSVAAVSGTATFSGLSINEPAKALTLIASATGLAPDTSAAFDILGPATRLRFVDPVVTAVRNGVLQPQLRVEALDVVDNIALGTVGSVTVAIQNNSGAATLGGIVTRPLGDGVATFDDLTLSAAGVGYTLRAELAGLTTAISNAFDVQPFGTATRLRFVDPPPSAEVATVLDPAVQVEVLDAEFNRVTTATNAVSLAFGTNNTGATLGGTATVSAAGGVATFPNLTVSAAGTYTLNATSGPLAAAVSGTFGIVNAGAAMRLIFAGQPTGTAAGGTISPTIQVCAVNSVGSVVAGYGGGITLSIKSGPADAVLLGGEFAIASGGCATFGDIRIERAGDYRLRASANALTEAASDVFTIDPLTVASHLAIVHSPANAVAGEMMQDSVVVEVQDQYGNRVTTSSLEATLCVVWSAPPFNGYSVSSSCAGAVEGSLVGVLTLNAVNGRAIFAGLRPRFASTGTDDHPLGEVNVLFLRAESSGIEPGMARITIAPSAPARPFHGALPMCALSGSC